MNDPPATLEVAIVEPDDLWDEVARFEPALVFADRADTLPDASRRGWVEFRPYEEPPAKICLGGRLKELEQIELSHLLSVVDEAEELARTSRDLQNY